jgi:uncharacterized membrane protein
MSLIIMIVGIALFGGAHFIPTRPALRQSLVGSLGEKGYKGLFTVLSIAGIALIAIGFGRYRAAGYIPVWDPPRGMAHLNILLMWFAFVAFASSGLPGEIKRRLKHPQLVGVKIWALGHLLANGDLGSIILFGAFLGWAVYDRISVKKRQPDAGKDIQPGFVANDFKAIGIGTVAWLVLMMAHRWLIGVSVFG